MAPLTPDNCPNFLVVDWDFFFRNPMLAKDPKRFIGLFDWGYNEAHKNLEPTLWTTRAAEFLARGLDLPGIQPWAGFWDRFQWRHPDNVPLVYADSNVHAGIITPGRSG